MTILVTGGAGYIGSHTVVELLNNGMEVIVIDDFSNSSMTAINRVEKITGKTVKVYEGTILDINFLNLVFSRHDIHAVIHFAGFKSVGESVDKPLRYYENNVSGTIILCQVMAQFNVKKLVFSSSATVYGKPKTLPIKEDFPTTSTNPYGSSKLFAENILEDLCKSDNDWNIICLRYFNPVGAHESGLIGEAPVDIPNNIMPYIAQVAVGKLEKVFIFGGDYDTVDGTGVRDYIHVVDLAIGHIRALSSNFCSSGFSIYNLGTGVGTSVLQLISEYETISGQAINYEVVSRRVGDIASCFSNPTKAENELDWNSKYTLKDMVSSSWKWQFSNKNGFED